VGAHGWEIVEDCLSRSSSYHKVRWLRNWMEKE
jgi:hypothetical protein